MTIKSTKNKPEMLKNKKLNNQTLLSTKKLSFKTRREGGSFHALNILIYSQLVFTCSKSTMETPEQCLKSLLGPIYYIVMVFYSWL